MTDSATTAATPVEDPFPSWRAGWAVVAILFLASIVSVVDRSILSVVVDPVRHDLGLSEVQVGLLQGLAFSIFYVAVGVPLGMTADRVTRTRLVTFGILVWSLATIAGGLVHSFAGLFASRLLVGMGEATLGPSAVSLIADLFPPDRRGKPLSVYLMGQALGAGVAIFLTTTILTAATQGGFAGFPVLGGAVPWRATFICCGLLGLVVVALMLTTREPVRRGVRGQVAVARPPRDRVAFLRRNASVLVPLYLAFALTFFGAYAGAAWAPTMLMRGRGLTPAQMGAVLAPFQIGFSLVGPMAGGILVDRLAGRGRPLAKFGILVVAPLLAIPSALAVFAPTPVTAMILVASSSAVYAVVGTTTFSLLQSIMSADMRGTSIAVSGFVNTLLAATLGPLAVATVTTQVMGNPVKVGYSIAIVVAPALLLASAGFVFAWRCMERQRKQGGEAAMMLVEVDARAAALRAAR